MATKTTQAEPPKDVPEAKKAKTEDAVETEEDDKADSRPAIKETISFNTADTSLNVVPVSGGNMLMLNSEGGLQYLIAGARANVGMKSGRYFYEVSICEMLNHSEKDNRQKSPMPKQSLRVGFSTAGSSLILGDGADGIGFDSNGNFLADKKSRSIGSGHVALARGKTYGVLLNLDASSPNANTVSFFRDGKRACPPQPLPDDLKGKVLYPHVSFRNVTVNVHFGPEPMTTLPFKCRTLQQAAKADVQENKAAAPKNGKYDVVFPVGFPDEGTFTWLDMFLEKNPQYVELSDRAIQSWLTKSGLWNTRSQQTSNDKPQFNFGVGLVDDVSIRRALMMLAPLVPRHYVVMEVKQNLVTNDRKALLKRFNLPHFSKIAKVMMGEPKADYKERVHERVLKDKQQKADADWRRQKAEKQRKKEAAKKEKEAKAKKEKAAEDQKKRKEEAEKKKQELLDKKKKAAEDAKKKEAGEEVKEEEKKEEEKKDVEMKTEEAKEEPKEEPKAEEPKKEEEEEEDDGMGTEPPKVDLTEEDKKINFCPPLIKDLTDNTLSQSFGDFSIPQKSDGFDKIEFEWQSEAESNEYLKKWRLSKKLATIVDTKPGDWFKTSLAEFQKTTEEYKAKQAAWKAKKPKATKKKDADEDERGEDVDLYEVKDVCDVGKGEPLFSNFSFEDWAIFTLRYELYLLLEGFKKDVNDAERSGIPEAHLQQYFTRYFKKKVEPKQYNKDNLKDLCSYAKEVAEVVDGVLTCKLAADSPGDAATFVKFQEESRRERQRRLDAGDESVRLNFEVMKKAIEDEKQKVLKAAADAERAKKQAAEKEKQKKAEQEAAAKKKLEDAKKAVLEKAKPAASLKEAATKVVTWKSADTPATAKPVTPGPKFAQVGSKPAPQAMASKPSWGTAAPSTTSATSSSKWGSDKNASAVKQTAWGTDKGKGASKSSTQAPWEKKDSSWQKPGASGQKGDSWQKQDNSYQNKGSSWQNQQSKGAKGGKGGGKGW